MPTVLPVTRQVQVQIPETIVQWDGGQSGTGTDWNDPTDWVGDAVPGPNDVVVINAPAGVTVNYSGGTDAIYSLRSFQPVHAFRRHPRGSHDS